MKRLVARIQAFIKEPLRRRVIATTVAGVLIVGLAVPAVRWILEKPQLGLGLELEEGGTAVVTKVTEGGSAARAGLAPGDTLLAIGSLEVPLLRGRDDLREFFYDVYDRYAPAERIEWQVRRGGKRRVLTGRMVPDAHERRVVGSHLLVFGVFWIVAFFLLFARPKEKVVRHLAYTVLVLTVEILYRPYEGPVTGGFGLAIEQVRQVCGLFGAPLVVHFGIIFPSESISRQVRKKVLAGAYGTWGVLFLVDQTFTVRALLHPSIDHAFVPQFLDSWHYATISYGLFVGAFIACGALLAHTYWQAAEEAVRDKIKWVMWSILTVGLLDAFMTGIGFYVIGGRAWSALEPYRTALYLLIAGGLSIAVFRHDLFDVDAVIRQSALYFSTFGLLFVIFAATEEVVERVVSRILPAQSKGIGAGAAAVLASVLFEPVRTRVQKSVSTFLPEPDR